VNCFLVVQKSILLQICLSTCLYRLCSLDFVKLGIFYSNWIAPLFTILVVLSFFLKALLSYFILQFSNLCFYCITVFWNKVLPVILYLSLLVLFFLLKMPVFKLKDSLVVLPSGIFELYCISFDKKVSVLFILNLFEILDSLSFKY
jgi:hypothetical protein